MSKRGENIWRRKDGRWEARYIKGRNGARAVYGYLYAKSYAEVKAKKMEVQQECADRPAAMSRESFSALADAFLCRKKHHVKESTVSNYRYRIDRYLIPYWGNTPLQHIDSIAVDKFTDHLFCVFHLAPKTVKDVLSLFDSVLKFGCENI